MRLHSIAIDQSGPIAASIRPPGSKSLTNRALICAALAAGTSRLTGALDSEDTRVMIEALRAIGIDVQVQEHGKLLLVPGCGGKRPQVATQVEELFVANSGTTMRFLTAMLAALGGEYRLDGVARMRERPIGDLMQALQTLGADLRGELRPDCPPLRIRSSGLRGGRAVVRGEISSQFLSGLLMAAPYARQDVVIAVDGPLVSQPYVEMTLQVMESFGVHVARPATTPDGGPAWQFTVAAPQRYQGREYAIEPDASAASYFWAAAAITGGRVCVEGLTFAALQGDVAFCRCLEQMGCLVEEMGGGEAAGLEVTGRPLHGIDVDMNGISDTVQTLAAVALFAEGPTRVRGVAHIRHKETDRIGDLARELRKLGATVEEHPDGLTIVPGKLRAAEIDTYNDHRMAMSLALVGLKQPGVVIRDPQCVDKTYPEFFADLARCRA